MAQLLQFAFGRLVVDGEEFEISVEIPRVLWGKALDS